MASEEILPSDVETLQRMVRELRKEKNAMLSRIQREASEAAAAAASKEKRKNVDEDAFAAELRELSKKALTVVVVGASGHLARTKTYPALCALFANKLLPPHTSIVGFARSELSHDKFVEQISPKLKGSPEAKRQFLARCSYFAGAYDSSEAFARLHQMLCDQEAKSGGPAANRVFYFAIPPSVFGATSKSLRQAAWSQTGWNRIIVEKPLGRDLDSSNELTRELATYFSESDIYRIDHYLGKEMVQNLMILRFANLIFEPLWNRNYVSNVVITFKENVGVEGRGGYFDEFGIIRDVMQNHLMQILTLVAMESPVSLQSEDIRNEKVKVLRAIRPLTLRDVIVGQYTANAELKQVGYTEDPTVRKDSLVPTFALAVLEVNNARWAGVPFVLKCGKGLNERKAEVRVQFKNVPGCIFGDKPVNELVLRVQPDEAIYCKVLTKTPGLSEGTEQSELDLSYMERFNVGPLPDAYERLILDVMRGDHRLFVRNDELEFAWRIFTPLLHTLDKDKVRPIPYPFGARGPPEADQRLRDIGVRRYTDYKWVGKK
jgi:glucose-6-phosphate 1-dehydrogenase